MSRTSWGSLGLVPCSVLASGSVALHVTPWQMWSKAKGCWSIPCSTSPAVFKKDNPRRNMSPSQAVEIECVHVQTHLATLWMGSDFTPFSCQGWTIYLHCRYLKNLNVLNAFYSSSIALWVCVLESSLSEHAYIQDRCRGPALAHADIHILVTFSQSL